MELEWIPSTLSHCSRVGSLSLPHTEPLVCPEQKQPLGYFPPPATQKEDF